MWAQNFLVRVTTRVGHHWLESRAWLTKLPPDLISKIQRLEEESKNYQLSKTSERNILGAK